MRQVGATAAPLLTYSLTTDPMPVQVSLSSTSPSIATLTFVVSCPKSTKSATVAAIEIILPVDEKGIEDAANLCMVEPSLSSASISSSAGDVWIPSSAGPGASGAFYFMPQAGTVLVTKQSLTIEFTGIEVNTLVGTALVTINEWAVPGSGTPPTPDDNPSGQQFTAVAKFPYGFYAGNFTSDRPMVKKGDPKPPVLSWTGSSNATYLMLYESNAVDVSNVQSWSPLNQLTQITTFILQVSAQQEDQDQTATMDFSITIEVENPSLTAQDLTVLTTSTLAGPVNVGTSETPANLVVNGDVQAGNNLTVVGPLNAHAALNVTGPTSLGNDLKVSGAGTFSGGLTSNNGLTAGGVISIFGERQKLAREITLQARTASSWALFTLRRRPPFTRISLFLVCRTA